MMRDAMMTCAMCAMMRVRDVRDACVRYCAMCVCDVRKCIDACACAVMR
jgi:hypothetical protein